MKLFMTSIQSKATLYFTGLSYFILFFQLSCNTQEKKKWKYTPFSQGVIQLNIMNDPGVSYYVTVEDYSRYIPRGWSGSQTKKIDQKGDYALFADLEKPGKIYLNFGEQSFTFFLFPKDTTIMHIKFFNDGYDVSFSGISSRINRYYLEKGIRFKSPSINNVFELIRHSSTNHELISVKIDSLVDEQLAFLDEYKSKHRLSGNFLDYEQSEIMYSGLLFKITLPSFLDRQRYYSGTISDDYFDFINDTEIDNSKAIYSKSYFNFLDEYMKLKYPFEEDDSQNWIAQLKTQTSNELINIKNELSGGVLNIYNLKKFSYLIPHLSDTIEINSIIRQFNIVNYKPILKLAGTRNEEGRKIKKLTPGTKISKTYATDVNGNLVSLRNYMDKPLLLAFYDTLNSPTSSNESITDLYKLEKIEKINYINICVGCDFEKWKTSHAEESLDVIELVAEFNWGESIKDYFDLKKMPHYVLLDTGNVFCRNITDQSVLKISIDSLLVNY